MPEKIVLEDGTEREVPTQEELEALQQASVKATELETTLTSKEQEWVDKQKEMEEMINPNWKAAREKIGRLEKLEAQGKSLDDEGNIVEGNQPPPVNTEELVGQATAAGKSAAMEALLFERRKALLTKYDADTKGVVEHYFNKLVADEELTLDNMEDFVKKAETLAVPAGDDATPPLAGGAPPRFKPAEGQTFADSPEAKDIAKEIWGPKAFSNESK